jgi:hypothetical protein
MAGEGERRHAAFDMLHSRCNAAVIWPGAARDGHDEMITHSIHRSTVLDNVLGSDQKHKNVVSPREPKTWERLTPKTKKKSTHKIRICVETEFWTPADASSNKNKLLRSQIGDAHQTFVPRVSGRTAKNYPRSSTVEPIQPQRLIG